MPTVRLSLVDDRGEQIDDLMTVEQASSAIGVTRGRISQLTADGTLTVHPVGPRFYGLERRQVEAYAVSYRKPGPKPADF